MAGGPIFVLLYAHIGVEHPLRSLKSQKLLRILVLTGYILARVYLVVEVFIAIPYVDSGVYQDINWPNYWPHIN